MSVSVPGLLAMAVAALGGSERRGQIEMATAVAHAFETGEHLVVQAGTGTGKSLAYLVPAIVHSVRGDAPVVVSTATIALQRQLVDRDLPRLADSLAGYLPRRPTFALLKGRRNYLCLNKIHGSTSSGSTEPDSTGAQDRPQEELFDSMAVTTLGRDVQRLTAWASTTESGDRDDLKPGVSDRSWSQVSVTARECIGVARCPFGSECFSERARGRAGAADIVVTNHALLAIDAVAESAVLPEHTLLVVDEAHELVDRVTSVATAELTSANLGVAARRVTRLVSPELTQRLEATSATLAAAIHDATPGRMDHLDEETTTYLAALRDAAHAARSAIDSTNDAKAAAARAEAAALMTEICDTAARILTSFTRAIPDRTDVVWVDHEDNRGAPRAVLRVAPLSVAGLLATEVFARSTTTLTSATLTIGGSFEPMAAAWGLTGRETSQDTAWRGLDVGSPFHHATSGILYVAAHLPPPGRDSAGSAEQLTRKSQNSSLRPEDAPWACSPRCAPPGPPPRPCATGCPHRCCARATTARPPSSNSSPKTPRLPCSVRYRCGRASTFRGHLCHWYSSIASRFPGLTTRCSAHDSERWRPPAATGSWPSPRATPRCCWRRDRAGCCAASQTAV